MTNTALQFEATILNDRRPAAHIRKQTLKKRPCLGELRPFSQQNSLCHAVPLLNFLLPVFLCGRNTASTSHPVLCLGRVLLLSIFISTCFFPVELNVRRRSCVGTVKYFRLRDRNAIITSKWMCPYDSDRKYRSEWERLFVQKAADGSVCKLLHHFTQSVQFHKPWKVRKISAPVQCHYLILISKKFWYSCNSDAVCDRVMAILPIKFGFFWPSHRRFSLFLASFLHCLFFLSFHLATLVCTLIQLHWMKCRQYHLI